MILSDETFMYRAWMNMGLSAICFIIMSVFTDNADLYRRMTEAFGGILVILAMFNGLKWLRLETENGKKG